MRTCLPIIIEFTTSWSTCGQYSYSNLPQSFPAEGPRQAVAVEVLRSATCETLCGLIATQLDVADARVVLRDRRGGKAPEVENDNGKKMGTTSMYVEILLHGILEMDLKAASVFSFHGVPYAHVCFALTADSKTPLREAGDRAMLCTRTWVCAN